MSRPYPILWVVPLVLTWTLAILTDYCTYQEQSFPRNHHRRQVSMRGVESCVIESNVIG